MKLGQRLSLLVALFILLSLRNISSVHAAENDPTGEDAFLPPAIERSLAAANPSTNPGPGRYQPSAFMAGRVAVHAVFVESNGGLEPSSEDWTREQITAIQSRIREALTWWEARLPNAHLRFDLTTQVVASRYEPIQHNLATERLWISDVLAQIGHHGADYFEQAYDADESLRKTRHTEWATTIFVVNSASDLDGRFIDGYFAYAYIGGPFLVLTSDVGPYGTDEMAPIVAHEIGHIFGALDQYAEAGAGCAERSGYLSVLNTNSQVNKCGTLDMSIMLEPQTAYAYGLVDNSALGQIGYRDEDRDDLPDPLDTSPVLEITLKQSASKGRPVVTGQAIDQPYPSPAQTSTTVNTITQIEYRVDQGKWIPLPPADQAYDSALESIDYTLALYDGQHTVELRAINSVGAVSPIYRTTITVRGIGDMPDYRVEAPSLVNTTSITVSLSAPEGSAIQISEQLSFAEADWMPIQEPLVQQITAVDGLHTLYVRFRDQKGNVSPLFNLPVTLDREAPTGEALIRGDTTPLLELHAQDRTSGVVAMRLILDSEASQDWQSFQESVPLSSHLTAVAVQLRDAAGNVSRPIPTRRVHLMYLPTLLNA